MSSKEFIEGFIEMYRSHECLWKPTSPEYTNKKIKNNAYKELVEYCKKNYDKADSDFVKQKIQNLRTAFRKEFKKVLDSKKSGADDIYFPKLWYYELLLFTVDDVLPQPSLDCRNNNEFEEENRAEEFFDEDTSSGSNKKMKIDERNSASPTSAISQPGIAHKSKDFKFPSTSKQSARNQSNKSLRNKEEDFPPTSADVINQISKNKKTINDVDEFDALAISWAAKLRKLKEKQMVLAEGIISEVLKKAYFEELTRATKIKDDMAIESSTSSCHSWPSRSYEFVSPRSTELVSPQSVGLVSPRSTENTPYNENDPYNENNIPQDGQQSNTSTFYSEFSEDLLSDNKMDLKLAEKPFSCRLCGYSTSMLSILDRHIQRHTGISRGIYYKFTQCDKHAIN